ncbi:MAG TPA: hypothetical protein VM580_03065 [Labilithrix sp.]|jgi:hypothetical protein|nr:hypothetical protein [Labilithrix sp.]
MSERTSIGRHAIWREPDTGFVHFVHDGMFDEEAAATFLDVMMRYVSDLPPGEPAFLITDNRRATGFTSKARKVLASANGMPNNSCVAVFGVSFIFAAALKLLTKTFALVATTKIHVSVFAGEAEARAWLAEQQLLYGTRKANA